MTLPHRRGFCCRHLEIGDGKVLVDIDVLRDRIEHFRNEKTRFLGVWGAGCPYDEADAWL